MARLRLSMREESDKGNQMARQYLGDYVQSGTVDFIFTTHDASGNPTTLSASPILFVYKANNTTPSSAITLTVDFASKTGQNHARISLTPAFFATANDYNVTVKQGNVDGASIAGYALATFSILNRSALRPTTPGRTLDVSSGGEAGLDWANVGSPTTVVGLSGTTVKTATDVETDTVDIQARLPAALVSGRMDSNTQAMATGVITAAKFAAGAIDAAAIATDAITAAKIAADAIGASELAADAVTEIAAGITIPSAATIADAVWDEVMSGHVAAGSAGYFQKIIKACVQNRWKISGTTLTLYDDDGTTALLTCSIKDKNGTAINSSSFNATTMAERTALS